jgi:hypothetical protein
MVKKLIKLIKLFSPSLTAKNTSKHLQARAGKPYWRIRLSTIDLLVRSALFSTEINIHFVTKQDTLIEGQLY